jgi:hypothetical protein
MAGKNQAPVVSELMAIATAEPTHQAAKPESQKGVKGSENEAGPLGNQPPSDKALSQDNN